ncbi:hypothetical protein PISMIDRAFT_680010 [Pisolithus microcarpus 441]|uniref:Uncharacterized protein n=1 Tax=Pisolithus microcarpus 441 TaxID=765257 RepID=A0A0C9ZS75_9AGAM|nr:hypothetical protein PISMIDRAFT_680010 [Pisolithus microcarpus 441]
MCPVQQHTLYTKSERAERYARPNYRVARVASSSAADFLPRRMGVLQFLSHVVSPGSLLKFGSLVLEPWTTA